MKTDTKRTKPKPKARRMWANYYPYGPVPDTFDSKARAMSWAKYLPATVTVPVAVIPLDDVDTLIVAASAAHYSAECEGKRLKRPVTNGDCMRAALTSIGVLPKRKGGRK
jgi:hypothetical protein